MLRRLSRIYASLYLSVSLTSIALGAGSTYPTADGVQGNGEVVREIPPAKAKSSVIPEHSVLTRSLARNADGYLRQRMANQAEATIERLETLGSNTEALRARLIALRFATATSITPNNAWKW